ncbi:hypothetical protein BsWGS_16882 [Bradybaena similaris]
METGLTRDAHLFAVVLFYCSLLLVTGESVTSTSADLKNNSQYVKPTAVSKLTPKTAYTNSTASSTAPTASVSYCQLKDYEECPNRWVLTNDDRCVLILNQLNLYSMPTYRDHCEDSGGYTVANISDSLRKCLQRVMRGYSVTSILLRDSKIMSLETGVVTQPRSSYLYPSIPVQVVCFIERTSWEVPKVTSFQVNITDEIKGTWRQVDLLDNTSNVTLVEEPEDLLNFTCQATGNPIPEPRIYYNYMFWGKSFAIVRGARCENSGVYTCIASNSFGSVSVTKNITVKHTLEINKFYVDAHFQILKLGLAMILYCSTNECSPPKLLYITDYTHTIIASTRDSHNLVAVISDVSCSDRGHYFCVAESESGSRVEKKTEVDVNDRCPVQVCRGQHESNIVHAKLGQTFNISLCLMSREIPTFVRQPQDKKLSVIFARAPQSLVVVQAFITIANISDSDYRTYTLGFKNYFGTYLHNLTIVPQGVSSCPSGITETSHGTSYISLSWKHRFAFSYHVFFSSNNMTWHYSPVSKGASSTTITGLLEDTKYFFRIAALLPSFQEVDENSCVLTVVFKTDAHAEPPLLESASESKRTHTASQSQPQTLILSQSDSLLQEGHGVLVTTLPLVAVNMALIIVFAGFIYWKRGRLFQNLGSNKTTGHEAGPNLGMVNDQF